MDLKFAFTIPLYMDSRIYDKSHLLGNLVATLAVTQTDHLLLAGMAYKLGSVLEVRSKGFTECIQEVSVQISQSS